MENNNLPYEKIIQGQLAALETLLKKNEALLLKTQKENNILEERIALLEKENKKYSQQKLANSVFEANIPVHEKEALLIKIEKYIKAIDLTIEKINNKV